MTDEQQLEEIKGMDAKALLAYLLSFPEAMTDSYYSKFRVAILARADQLGVFEP